MSHKWGTRNLETEHTQILRHRIRVAYGRQFTWAGSPEEVIFQLSFDHRRVKEWRKSQGKVNKPHAADGESLLAKQSSRVAECTGKEV